MLSSLLDGRLSNRQHHRVSRMASIGDVIVAENEGEPGAQDVKRAE
jgi:hypothetical protein